ncbi:MAG: hypothetical protein LUC83_03045 [Clostridiales bacterium]|nr:hypothetical protein [Clostridiales bacterium]
MSKTYIADKETLDKVYNIVSASAEYGFIEHCATLAPGSRIEYIGANADYTAMTVDKSTGAPSYGSWADFPIITGNKPYMVKSDGTPDYRLDEDDYTLREDGEASDISNDEYDGGAFSWFPKVYKYEKMVGDDRIVKFSFEKKDGFEAVGFIDPDGNELEGVWIPMFYGSIVDSVMRSNAGNQPCYSNTTAVEKTAIDAFGDRAKFLGGPIIETIIDILIMLGKNTNLQSVFGSGNSSGYDSSLSPTYGVLENAVVSGGQFYGTSDGKSLNKIFHSIVLGSYQQYMRDPYTLVVNGRFMVSKDYTYDLTGAAYEDTGIDVSAPESSSWSYPHRYQTVPGFGALPVYPYKGSTSTGGCDGFYRNASQATITAVARRFGHCNLGTNAGPRCLYVYNTATYSYWSIGAAILLLPPVGVAA